MAQTRIFVSHSSKDDDWARPFAAALTAIGYDVWYDETGLQGGAAWVASIQREVETRDVFLLVLTPEAWESKWVQDELQLAIATRRRILPVLLRNTQISGFLLTTQWITVIGEEPQAAARAAVMAIEAPPAPGRDAAPVATTETLDELIVLCRSLASEKRYTESLAACGRALALDPKNLSVLKIKAWVLHQIGESRLEGCTRFQILMINPKDSEAQVADIIFPALDDEREILLAHSLLASHMGQSGENLKLLLPFLTALNRLNRLDAATDILSGLSERGTRELVYSHLAWRRLNRDDYAVRIFEEWYGNPPNLSAVTDIPELHQYAKSLDQLGRTKDAWRENAKIVQIFESKYAHNLRVSLPPISLPGADQRTYWNFLDALRAIGRSYDADMLKGKRVIYD